MDAVVGHDEIIAVPREFILQQLDEIVFVIHQQNPGRHDVNLARPVPFATTAGLKPRDELETLILAKTLFAPAKSVITLRVMPTRQGSFRLFKLFGVEVFLHWSWFLVAIYGIQTRMSSYSSLTWPVLEYLTLFLIVLMHEFGHALACRSVGGQANQIVLWPLGGVAYVTPPQRAGAMLWSIAAGPLVNVVLFPILSMMWWLVYSPEWVQNAPETYHFIQAIWFINTGLLVFNLLPVYPLDGGQILRSLLWFVFGRARSLMIASIIGFVGVAGLVALAFWLQSIWLGILCAFIAMNCWNGFKQAQALMRISNAPRHPGYACPVCRTAPPQGEFWLCGNCRKPFDTFAAQANCPHCGVQYPVTACPECGSQRPFSEWMISSFVPHQS